MDKYFLLLMASPILLTIAVVFLAFAVRARQKRRYTRPENSEMLDRVLVSSFKGEDDDKSTHEHRLR